MLFINPRSGGGKAARTGLAERARDKEIEAVILAAGQDLAALAASASTVTDGQASAITPTTTARMPRAIRDVPQ